MLEDHTPTENLTIEIFDLTGKQVYAQSSPGEQKIILHRNQLLTGIYIYHLSNNGNRIGTGKLIVR